MTNAEPSKQEHHNAETEEDTASGGAAEPPSTDKGDGRSDDEGAADGEPGRPADAAGGASADQFTITDVPAQSEYQLFDGDKSIGFAQYVRKPGEVTFTHTVVDKSYGGQGLGTRLAKHVLDDAVSRDERIVPVCSFIAAYVRRHHDYDGLIDWPEVA